MHDLLHALLILAAAAPLTWALAVFVDTLDPRGKRPKHGFRPIFRHPPGLPHDFPRRSREQPPELHALYPSL